MDSARLKAEERFAKLKQQEKKAQKERERSSQEVTDKIARLRALRLAKEAADREAAAAEAESKPKAKSGRRSAAK